MTYFYFQVLPVVCGVYTVRYWGYRGGSPTAVQA